MDLLLKPKIHKNPKESSTINCFKVSGTYTWTIYDFGFAFDSECNFEDPFCSSNFTFGNNEELEWAIELYPSLDNEYITLKIVYHDQDITEELQAECEVSILGKNVVHTVKTDSLHNFSEMNWEKYDFIKKNYLMNEENGLLIKNKLTLFCQIDVTRYCDIKENITVEHEIFKNRLKVSEDLQLLMNNKSYDIILVLKNEKYYVHKCILASHSPVFSAMFDHCMQEQMNGEVVLTDISGETLKKLIHFIYTGIIININEISKEILKELLVAADKYEINDLKEICEMVFYNKLNTSNAMEMLVLADRHNAEQLKNAVVHFITANIKEFNKTLQFEIFSTYYSLLLPKFIEMSEGRIFDIFIKPCACDFKKFYNSSIMMQSTTVKKNSWCVTQMVVNKDTYTWKINNFSHFIEKEFIDEHFNEPIISPKFGRHKEYSWKLHLFPKGVNNKTKDYISLYINFSANQKKKEIKARYKFFIIDSEGQKRNNFKSDILIFTSYGKTFGEDKFLKKDFLMENKDKLLPNNSLTIMCKVNSGTSSRWDSNRLYHMHLTSPKYQFRISTNQIKLFESGKFSDLTLVSGNKKFPVHRNILSVRSPVFFTMLSEQLTKGKTVIEVSDVNPAVLQNFLLFVYSGNVDNLEVTAKDLHIEARKYNVENLKDLCETYLSSNLSVENVCDNFVFAHINMACKLKSSSLDYIINNINKVYSTSGYSNLANSRPQLLKDIIYKLHF